MSQDDGRSDDSKNLARFPANSRRMARDAWCSSLLTIGFSATVLAGDGDDDLPVLARPTEMPAIVSTPATKAAKPAPAPSTAGRSVLALPGITTPSAGKAATSAPSTSSDGSLGDFKLEAPLEMNGAPSTIAPLPRVAPSTGRSARPLILESDDGEPTPIDGPPSNSPSDSKRPSTASRVNPQAALQPQRRGRFFGLFPAPAPAPSSNVSGGAGASMTSKAVAPGRSVVEVPAADPLADSAIKRRIEKQAREAVGDRARTIEVHVVGKSASVQVRGVKLFQKRPVRKSLESLPSLTGLRSTIEVLD